LIAYFDDANDPEYLKERVNEIVDELGITPSNCHVILDFQDLSTSTLVGVMEDFDTLFPLLLSFKFATYSIAGCSLPRETANKPRNLVLEPAFAFAV